MPEIDAVNDDGLELNGCCGPGVQVGTLVGTILGYRSDIDGHVLSVSSYSRSKWSRGSL